jgi:hypothetical protein
MPEALLDEFVERVTERVLERLDIRREPEPRWGSGDGLTLCARLEALEARVAELEQRHARVPMP